MASKYLAREDAPFGSDTWKLLDTVMVEAAKGRLAGRRLLHIEGPFGLGLKVVPLGDKEVTSGVFASEVLPVVMIQKSFSLNTRDLATYERDGLGLDTSAVAETAIACARDEDNLVLNGTRGMPGLVKVKGSNAIDLSSWDEVGTSGDDIIKAMTVLDNAGFHGPYTMALAPSRYNLLFRRYPRGNFSEMEHARTMVTEGIYKAPALKSGGILLASGSQYASIVLGQDLTIGFVGPAGTDLEFTMNESLAVRVRQPQAICVLKG